MDDRIHGAMTTDPYLKPTIDYHHSCISTDFATKKWIPHGILIYKDLKVDIIEFEQNEPIV